MTHRIEREEKLDRFLDQWLETPFEVPEPSTQLEGRILAAIEQETLQGKFHRPWWTRLMGESYRSSPSPLVGEGWGEGFKGGFRTRSKGWAFGGAFALLLAAGLLWRPWHQTSPASLLGGGVVEHVSGPVWIVSPEGTRRPAHAGDRISASGAPGAASPASGRIGLNDQIYTERGELLLLVGGHRVAVKPHTTVAVVPHTPAVVDLSQGTVEIAVEKGKGGFTVRTPLGEARALGTRFRVSVMPPPRITPQTSRTQKGGNPMNVKPFMNVLVLAGVVAVNNAYGTVVLDAQERAVVVEGCAPAKQAAVAAVEPPTHTALQNALMQLTDKDPNIREEAVVRVLQFDDPSTIPFLIKVLDDPLPQVRRAAAPALQQFDDPRVVPAIIKALGDSDEEVRTVGAMSLGLQMHNPLAVPALMKLTKDSSSLVRKGMVLALAHSNDRDAVVPILINVMTTDPDHDVRTGAGRYMQEIVNISDVPALLNVLKHADPGVRFWAVQLLAIINEPSTIPSVINMMEDGDATVRRAAVLVLLQTRDPKIIPRLVKFIERIKVIEITLEGDNTEHGTAFQIVKGLTGWNDPRVGGSPFTSTTNDPDPLWMKKVFEMYGNILNDSNPKMLRLKIEVTRALGMIQDPSAIPMLIAHLHDADLCLPILAALGGQNISYGSEMPLNVGPEMIQDPRVIPSQDPTAISLIASVIEETGSQPNVIVPKNKYAIRLLGAIQHPDAIPFLAHLIYVPKKHNEITRGEAVQALSQIPDPRALLPLRQAWKDSSRSVREAARQALDQRGEIDNNLPLLKKKRP